MTLGNMRANGSVALAISDELYDRLFRYFGCSVPD
jgi:hypothetical protein